MYYLPVAIVILSTIVYQLVIKITPNQVNPLITLFVTYLAAAGFCMLLYPFFSQGETVLENFKKINWTSFMLGLAVVGIEAGFLLAYRAGWPFSTTSQMANSIVAMAILVIGMLIFKDKITLLKGAGILLCMTGVFLINFR